MSRSETVWIVDDDRSIRWVLEKALQQEGMTTQSFDSADGVLNRLSRQQPDVIISDIRMPGASGLDLLAQIREHYPRLPVIIMTAHSDLDSAVASYQGGAFEYLPKPFDVDEAVSLIKRANLHAQEQQGLEVPAIQANTPEIIGEAPAMQEVFRAIGRLSHSNITVLINGESGTGKELVAHALHRHSPRAKAPFIALNMAAIPKELMESELFGHEKGAFTGAAGRRRGRFELAHEGTLFLDEIGEIDQNVQIKILRVLQDKKFERVGGEDTLEVDVRIIAATNRELKAEIEKGNFREDLFYRLNVVNIHVPPLRERKDDIPLLAASFLKEFARENGKKIEGLEARARAALYAYDWPGNIRELRNCLESAVVMSKGAVVALDDLPPSVRPTGEQGWMRIPVGTTLAEAEKVVIRETLSANKGNKSRAAEVLDIGRKTLHRKLAEYGEADAAEGAGAEAEGAEQEVAEQAGAR